jgi:hypothetical protein
MRIKKIAIITVLALTGLVAIAGAQASFSECNSGHVCMWGNNDFQWLIAERDEGNGLVNLSGERDNQMDSWANRGAYHNASGFGGQNGTGDCQTFAKGKSDNNVAFWNSDEVSSWRTNVGC